MKVPSFSRGCEIAQFFVRYMATDAEFTTAVWRAKNRASTREKCFENPDVIFCSSFQNLRLGSIRFLQKKNIAPQTNQQSASSHAFFVGRTRTVRLGRHYVPA